MILCLVNHRNSFIVLKNAVIRDVTSVILNNLGRMMEERNFVSVCFVKEDSTNPMSYGFISGNDKIYDLNFFLGLLLLQIFDRFCLLHRRSDDRNLMTETVLKSKASVNLTPLTWLSA
jgi:hypothetical protein